MIYNRLNIAPEEALNGTTVLHTYALSKNANFLRVHDVKEAVEIKTLLSNSLGMMLIVLSNRILFLNGKPFEFLLAGISIIRLSINQ